MAYSPGGLFKLFEEPNGKMRIWVYKGTDAVAAVNTAGFFSDGARRGLRVDDLIFAIDTDDHAVNILTVNASSVSGVDVTDGLAVGTVDSD